MKQIPSFEDMVKAIEANKEDVLKKELSKRVVINKAIAVKTLIT